MAAIPELEPHCGSWVVISRETGQPIFETFNRATARAVNQARYEVLTAAQWLGRFNVLVRANSGYQPSDAALRGAVRP